MSKVNKKIWCSLIVICLLAFCVPFSVFADGETYIVLPVGCTLFTTRTGYASTYLCTDTEDNRIVIQKISSTNARIGMFSPSSNAHFKATSSANTPTWQDQDKVNNTFTYNNSTYYGTWNTFPINSRVIHDPFFYTVPDGSYSMAELFEYAYGQYAVEPEPPRPVYGDLITGFYTQFAYSGQNNNSNWRANKDTITWDSVDTLGNSLDGLQIELRVVPAGYEATTKSNLFSQLISDLIIDNEADVTTLGWYSPYTGSASFTWEYIAQTLSPVWLRKYGTWSITAFSYQNGWAKVGWLYQARLYDPELEENLTEWQTIYTVTSIEPEPSEQLVTNPVLSPETINNFETVNNYNNTENNWYIENTEINMSNPDDTQQTGGKPWWSYLLEALVNLVNKILDFFGGLFDGFVDLLLGIFDNIDPVGFFTDIWNRLKNLFSSIDITGTDYNLPESDISSFWVLPQRTLQLLTENNLGYVLFIPLLIFILRLLL